MLMLNYSSFIKIIAKVENKQQATSNSGKELTPTVSKKYLSKSYFIQKLTFGIVTTVSLLGLVACQKKIPL